uniref:AAA-ATPase-like domain-containing protein n=1 Tax=Ditylenchus dipsaci TaxID=166011 RepID=A0A915D8V5_9BILA
MSDPLEENIKSPKVEKELTDVKKLKLVELVENHPALWDPKNSTSFLEELEEKKMAGKASKRELNDHLIMDQVLYGKGQMEKNDLVQGLERLTRILYNKYHQPSFVLLDEYDSLASAQIRREPPASLRDQIHSVIAPFFLSRNKPEQAGDLRSFFEAFMQPTFKDNKNMSHSIMGVGQDILSGTRLEPCNMQSNPFAAYFGFTAKDLHGFTEIMRRHDVQVDDRWKQIVSIHYNGYTCYTEDGNRSVQLFNPYSLSKYLCIYAKTNPAHQPVPKKWLVLYGKGQMEKNDLVQGLERLTRILYNKYHQPSFVLLDEYDSLASAQIRREPPASLRDQIHSVIAPFFLSRNKPEQAGDLRSFFEAFMQPTFKDNKNMSHSIMGVGQDILSGTRLEPCNMQSNPFAAYFGFTAKDLHGFTEIMRRHDVQVDDRWKQIVSIHYNGYTCYTEDGNRSVQLFNPYSLSKYLCIYAKTNPAHQPVPKKFWARASESSIDKLIAGQDVRVNYSNKLDFTLDDYKTVLQLCEQGDAVKVNDDTIHLVLTYLTHTGYLTVVAKENVFRIPNEEVRSVNIFLL